MKNISDTNFENVFENEMDFFTVKDMQRDFTKIDSEIIISKFKDLMHKLESNPNVILCMRGASKTYKEFLTIDNLKKFFIVGQKVNAHINEPIDKKYRHIEKLNKKNLILEIKQIIEEINTQIKNNPHRKKPLKGKISNKFIKNLKNCNILNLNKIKIFFLAFLHNSYKNKKFNSITPFLSMARGKEKFKIAKKFALGNDTKMDGYVFLYSLCTKSDRNIPDQYIITEDFMKVLKKIGLRFFEDRYSEVMLLNGMYPHYLLGIIKIKNKIISEFIMNPALEEVLKLNQEFKYEEGLKINQTNFKELAKELGYKTFFYTNGSKTYISDLPAKQIGKSMGVK